jgi:hypothetical protein
MLPSPTKAGPTATLIPLPTVTYQFPEVTPRGDLLVLAQPTEADVLPKGKSPFGLSLNFGGGLLIGLVLVLWAGLVAWFVLAHFFARHQ